MTGLTYSTNFPTTAGAFQTTLPGDTDPFVTEVNATGSALAYSTYLGGIEYNFGYGIAVDASGDAYVTGRTESINFPVTDGAFQTTFGGTSNAFVAKLSLPTPGPTASSTATATATIIVTPSPGVAPTATPTATATQTPTATPTPISEKLTISPSSLAFGKTVTVGTTSKAKTVTIKNAGKKKTGLAVSIESESALPSVFAVTSECKETLAPGKSCKVSVTFTPTDTTAQSGELAINDNASGSPQTVGLSGTGKVPKTKK